MKKVITAAVCLILLAGCITIGQKTIPEQQDKLYHTQYSIFYKNGVHKTTNYREGTLLPINSLVKVISIGGMDLTGNETFEILSTDGLHKVIISNVKSDSGLTLFDLRHRLLDENPVDLSKYTDQEASFIRKGQPAIGMSKDILLKAMGYPPVDDTPSLNASEWVYKRSLFQKSYYVFDENGIVKDIIHK
jgi:uncharacterized protein YceK